MFLFQIRSSKMSIGVIKVTDIINFNCLLYTYLYLKEMKSFAIVSVQFSAEYIKPRIFFSSCENWSSG